MDISIRTKSKHTKIWGCKAYYGEIQIDDFKETLFVPVEWWTLKDYRKQWQEGLERIKTKNRSCLVATAQLNPHNKLINWWVLYKVKNKIFVRNEMMAGSLFDKYIGDKLFTPETCYDFIGRRVIYKKRKISEWEVSLD